MEEVHTEVSLQGTGRVDVACNSKANAWSQAFTEVKSPTTPPETKLAG